MNNELQKNFKFTDTERLTTLITIKDKYLSGEYTMEEARAQLKEKIGTCTPDEFAYGEQQLKGTYTDEEITHRMDDLLALFDGILVRANNEFPENHPLWVYKQEINAAEDLAREAEALLQAPHFIKNPWLGLFDRFRQWPTHLSRKQNQLYPMLERYGFDRPTKIMWTFDDTVRESISRAYTLLTTDATDEFIAAMPKLIDDFRDLLGKEQEVLLPTAFKLLSEEDFAVMSRGDHEIGFALIPTPPFYGTVPADTVTTVNTETKAPAGFMDELAALLGKYNIGTTSKEEELDVATGKLSLERINLLFKHMPVDLSYVDENELVKFYSDTKHRIFPRSANVIGREVKNCHPAKSVHLVEEIIEKFRSGEQDKAEFWINKPDLFIYIIYTAVRDEQGNFKGVLEMMQDCTRIRSLEGSRTLLTWDDEVHGDTASAADTADNATDETDKADTGKADAGKTDTAEVTRTVKGITLTGDTKLFDLFDKVDGLKKHMPSIHPMFTMLATPMAKMMAGKATLEKVSHRSGIPLSELIQKIGDYIETK